jgi:hypothetical protein
MRSAALAASALLLVSCATVQSGGFKLNKDEVEQSFEAVKNRASFEFECPKDKLELVVLNALSSPMGDQVMQIGATGCGHKAVYVRSVGGWVMNTESGKVK